MSARSRRPHHQAAGTPSSAPSSQRCGRGERGEPDRQAHQAEHEDVDRHRGGREGIEQQRQPPDRPAAVVGRIAGHAARRRRLPQRGGDQAGHVGDARRSGRAAVRRSRRRRARAGTSSSDVAVAGGEERQAERRAGAARGLGDRGRLVHEADGDAAEDAGRRRWPRPRRGSPRRGGGRKASRARRGAAWSRPGRGRARSAPSRAARRQSAGGGRVAAEGRRGPRSPRARRRRGVRGCGWRTNQPSVMKCG